MRCVFFILPLWQQGRNTVCYKSGERLQILDCQARISSQFNSLPGRHHLSARNVLGPGVDIPAILLWGGGQAFYPLTWAAIGACICQRAFQDPAEGHPGKSRENSCDENNQIFPYHASERRVLPPGVHRLRVPVIILCTSGFQCGAHSPQGTQFDF